MNVAQAVLFPCGNQNTMTSAEAIGDGRGRCAMCNSSLGEEAVMALNRLWHPEHFICNSCKKPIQQTFQAADNVPYCINCFSNKFNPHCAGCKKTLVDSCLLALEKHWHPSCFRCFKCGKSLPNGEFYLVEGKPYDLDCHWQKRLEAYASELKKRYESHIPPSRDSREIDKDKTELSSCQHQSPSQTVILPRSPNASR